MKKPSSSDVSPEPISSDDSFEGALGDFENVYANQWGDARKQEENPGGVQVLRVASASQSRPESGNHPQILHHGKKTEHVVVLIHGITDSPYYVTAIARRFHQLGFNVVLPLLPAHGVRTPWKAMKELEHQHWLKHVATILNIASKLGDRVSMGGFSTGGALTVHTLTRKPQAITGGVYLFSAALEIPFEFLLKTEVGDGIGEIIDHKKWLVASVKNRVEMLTKAKRKKENRDDAYGIGKNPYKYSVFFYDGAAELGEVVAEIDESQFSNIQQPVFIAHSRHDESALIAGTEKLAAKHPGRHNDKTKSKVVFFEINHKPPVAHSSLVLEKDIEELDKIDEHTRANPLFDKMMNDAAEGMVGFTRRHVMQQSQ